MNKNAVVSKVVSLAEAEKFGSIPVGIEVVEGILPMSCTLSFHAPCRVILFRPRALNALPACHT